MHLSLGQMFIETVGIGVVFEPTFVEGGGGGDSFRGEWLGLFWHGFS